MKTFYFLSSKNGSYNMNPRRCFTNKEQCQKALEDMESRGVPAEMEERTLKDNEHFWAVYISAFSYVTDYDAMYCSATSEAVARRKGEEYIRRWDICDQRIQKIAMMV